MMACNEDGMDLLTHEKTESRRVVSRVGRNGSSTAVQYNMNFCDVRISFLA